MGVRQLGHDYQSVKQDVPAYHHLLVFVCVWGGGGWGRGVGGGGGVVFVGAGRMVHGAGADGGNQIGASSRTCPPTTTCWWAGMVG